MGSAVPIWLQHGHDLLPAVQNGPQLSVTATSICWVLLMLIIATNLLGITYVDYCYQVIQNSVRVPD
jgi:hypothetical protein